MQPSQPAASPDCARQEELTVMSNSGAGEDRPAVREQVAGRQAAQPTPDTVYASEALFRGNREIAIRHEGEFYRLRITRQGKLILNK